MKLIRETVRLVKALVDAALANVHTHLPAQVVSFNATENTVEVQPCINRIRTDDPNNETTIRLPVIDDVPVQQFGSGDLLITCAPAEGSYGTLHFSERAIDQWLLQAGIVDPGSARRFDLSDAVFYPGVYPIGEMTAAVNTDRIELRSLDGTAFCALVDDGNLELNGDADFAVAYNDLKTAFDQLSTDFDTLVSTYNAHIHVTTATIGLGPAVGVIAPTTSTGSPTTADMAPSKVSTVKLP